MADFFRGLAGGFQSGLQLGQAMRDKQQREELAQVYAKPESYTDYTPAQQQQIQGLQASGAYNVEAVPGAEGVAPTLRYMPRQGLDLQGDMPVTAGIEIAPRQVQRYAGQVAEGQFDPMVLQGLRAREAARVVGAYGDPVRAAQLEADALRMEREAKEAPLRQKALEQNVELGGIQLQTAKTAREKDVGFDTAYKAHTEAEFKTPEDKRNDFLKLVEQYKGPEAAQHLRSSYNTNELAELNLKAAKYEEDLKAARIKGPDAVIAAINKLNPDLKLVRDGFTVYEETNGVRTPIIKSANAQDFALAVEARSKAGGALELANHEMQVAHNKAQTAYMAAMAHKAMSEGNANRLTNVQLGMERNPETGQLRQVMVGLQFNQKTKAYDEVRQPLTQNMIPMAALDPKTITAATEALVGTPIDPTNKSGPKHTSVTARQAVVDQIANQYLGTGTGKGGLAVDSVAAKILANQNPLASAPASAPAAPAATPVNLGVDPNRPKAGVSSVTGQPYLPPPSAPNLVAAVGEGLDTGKANYISYLKTKIDNNQPLTVDENNQAIRFKLK